MGKWQSNYRSSGSSQAWKYGYQAYLNGLDKTWCPIARGVEGRNDWLAGWNYAEREAMKAADQNTNREAAKK